jgi:hypothetical protein
MRTTINLGERAHEIAKRFAAAHQISLGEAISRLIEGDPVESSPSLVEGPKGLLLVAGTGHPFGVEEVRAVWAEE